MLCEIEALFFFMEGGGGDRFRVCGPVKMLRSGLSYLSFVTWWAFRGVHRSCRIL